MPADVTIENIQIPDEEGRKKVSSWIWEKNAAFDILNAGEKGEIPELTPDNIRAAVQRPLLTTEQRIDRALMSIGRPPNSAGNQPEFLVATECGDTDDEKDWLVGELKAAGLVRNTRDGPDSDWPLYMLTMKGLNRMETGGDALVSNTAFVAMWFEPSVASAYQEGIEPAIQRAGFEPMRIDRKHHVRKIDDEIIAEIRRCRFLVCDLTSSVLNDPKAQSGKTPVARGSVYFEAGFAKGLGKKVIWTCRSDLIGHVHFDLRQYKCILWETGKEKELREELYARIRAVIV